VSGFAVLFREAADHPLFAGDSSRLGAWTWLVLKGCWKPAKFNIGGKVVELQRGQLCASRAQLAEAWGWKPSAVERFLVRLETEQMIGRETGQGRTIITICNYAKYQDVEAKAGQEAGQDGGQPSDSDRTTKEQRNQETKDIPSPNGDGHGDAAPLALDLAKTLFRTGLVILQEAGHDERSARSIIGKWKKTYSESVVIAVLARCQSSQPEQPIEWITKGLQVEAERAAGVRTYHQDRPKRASVREIGMRLAGGLEDDEQPKLESSPRRLAVNGR
jgi:hypothetical protein